MTQREKSREKSREKNLKARKKSRQKKLSAKFEWHLLGSVHTAFVDKCNNKVNARI